MKFSILVPVYNVEKYLEQCVESLLNQTYNGEYEVILVDDGSTDSSGKICDEYAKNHPEKIKVIHKENGGHSSARLEAIKNASGDYSLFCDSDDFVEDILLETVENVLSKNPDTDMVMYSFCYYDNGKKMPRKVAVTENTEIFEGKKKKKLYELLITTPYINSLCTKTIKTEILKNDPTDYNILKDKDIAEDAYMVSCFVTACKKIININKALYNYRTNQESISRSCDPSKLMQKNTLFLYNHYKDHLSEWDINSNEYRKKLNARWLNEVMYTFTTYYENVSVKDRKVVLNFDWSSMLPVEVQTDTCNPFENKSYRKLYNLLSDKKYFCIRLHFLYKSFYKKFRNFKSRLINR